MLHKRIEHKDLINIRNQLLLRVSFVLSKLSQEHTVNSLCRYLGVSTSTFYKLKHPDTYKDKKYSFKNLDKLLSICERLRIEYSFTIHSKNGRTYSKFEAKTVSDWNNKSHNLNISSKQFH